MSAHDEYDDLDDLLEDANIQNDILAKPPGSAKDTSSSAKESEPAKPAVAVVSGSSAHEAEPDLSKLKLEDDAQDDAFAQQLQGDVDDLLKETEGDPQTQQLIEALISSIQQTSNTETKSDQPEPKEPPAAAPASFEDTISATMNRLNESQRQGSEEAGGSDFMERMLRELQNGAAGGDGGGLDDLLSSMMSELSSKDVLYEPMKDMHTKFPEWMATKGKEVSAEDRKRFEQQQALVAEIVATFEAPGYSDDNSESRQHITAKMEEMQSTGAPPDELVGDVAGGSLFGGSAPNGGGDGMPPLPSECATQ